MIDYTLPLEKLPDPLPIEPLRKPFDVTITPPGSKSITCRAYVLAALASGESTIIRPLRAEDTDLLLEALCTLGAEARWVPGAPGQDGEDVLITGVDGRFPRGGRVDLGDGGTPTRFMIAAACLAREPVVVDASPRMRERPIAEGVDMLRNLGATIEYIEEEGRLPVRVVPSERFKGGELTVGKTASSQSISAVMLIAPWLQYELSVNFKAEPTSAAYIRLTESVLDRWGADVQRIESKGLVHWVVNVDSLASREFVVEPDASSMTYWFTAAAVNKGAFVVNPNPRQSPRQPDSYYWQLMGSMGARLEGFSVEGSDQLNAIDADLSHCPDAAMSLAVACAVAEGTSTITGLQTLRVKETDRIAALANELRKVGCVVETTDDSIAITPPEEPTTEPIEIETYNDHRMAMSFAILGLVRPGLAIRNPACVRKSYPTFWRDFATLYE